MKLFAGLGLALALIVAAPAMAAPAAAKLTTTEMRVPGAGPGLGLYVRNKHLAGAARFGPARTVLFVHGATYPASTAFDLELGGKSWMDELARQGFDVYLVDLTGYGRSSRPAAMEQPPAANAPIETTDLAIADVSRGGRPDAQADRQFQAEPDRLVLGHHHHGRLCRRSPRQGRAAGALCAALGHRRRAARQPGQARRLSAGHPAGGLRPLDERGAGSQEGLADPARLVRRLGGGDLRHRPDHGQPQPRLAACADRHLLGRRPLLGRRTSRPGIR